MLLDAEIRSSPISAQAFTLLELVMASSNNLVLNIPDDILTCFNKVSSGCRLRHLYDTMCVSEDECYVNDIGVALD